MPEDNRLRPAAGAYVESASGTTNPDNANSGPAAWIVIAIAAVLLVAIGGTVTSCTAGVLEDVVASYLDDGYGYEYEYDVYGDDEYEYDYDFDEYTDDDFERMIRDYLDGQEDDSQDTSVGAGSGELSVTEAIGEGLAIYGDTIDDLVSANDYAGVDDDTRTWARELSSLDTDAANAVVRSLRAAARSDDPADGVAQARGAAARAEQDLAALTVPETAGEELAAQLEAARTSALVRWVAIDAQLALLDTDGDVDASELGQADAAVARATEDAAQALTDALLTAASE